MHHAEGHGWLAEETLNVSAEAWVLSVRFLPCRHGLVEPTLLVLGRRGW
jgi:hypothetical protein